MSARRWPRAHHPPRRWLCRCPPGHAALPAHIPKSAHRRAQPGGGNGHFFTPPNRAIFPRFSGRLNAATAPVWARASRINTPGITGWPGKCPWKKRLCAGHALDSARPLAGGIVKNLIHQSKRVTVRQDLFDFRRRQGPGRFIGCIVHPHSSQRLNTTQALWPPKPRLSLMA